MVNILLSIKDVDKITRQMIWKTSNKVSSLAQLSAKNKFKCLILLTERFDKRFWEFEKLLYNICRKKKLIFTKAIKEFIRKALFIQDGNIVCDSKVFKTQNNIYTNLQKIDFIFNLVVET